MRSLQKTRLFYGVKSSPDDPLKQPRSLKTCDNLKSDFQTFLACINQNTTQTARDLVGSCRTRYVKQKALMKQLGECSSRSSSFVAPHFCQELFVLQLTAPSASRGTSPEQFGLSQIQLDPSRRRKLYLFEPRRPFSCKATASRRVKKDKKVEQRVVPKCGMTTTPDLERI